MNEDLKKSICEHFELYNKAERVYKEVQLEALELDTGVLNEFRYCARSQAELLKLIADTNGKTLTNSITSALEVANRALCCAINDSIDVMVKYAKIAANDLNEKYEDVGIVSVYGLDNYLEFWKSIKNVENKIINSRENRSTRIDLYVSLLESSDLNKIKEFCFALEIIESQLKMKSKLEKASKKHFFYSHGINILIAIGTIASAMVAYFYAK